MYSYLSSYLHTHTCRNTYTHRDKSPVGSLFLWRTLIQCIKRKLCKGKVILLSLPWKEKEVVALEASTCPSPGPLQGTAGPLSIPITQFTVFLRIWFKWNHVPFGFFQPVVILWFIHVAVCVNGFFLSCCWFLWRCADCCPGAAEVRENPETTGTLPWADSR